MKRLTYRETLEELQIALKRLNPKELYGPDFVSEQGCMCACAALRIHLCHNTGVSSSMARDAFSSSYGWLMNAGIILNCDAVHDIITENGQCSSQSVTDRYDRMVLWVESKLETV
jgi:hypothetical protein